MTTALRGAGGFGKTTLARMMVHNPAVQQAFPDGIAWVTIGEDAHGADLAAKVNDVTETVSRSKPSLSDPALAGSALGAALGDRAAQAARTFPVAKLVESRAQAKTRRENPLKRGAGIGVRGPGAAPVVSSFPAR